jgi:omega-6 fatty acid desaturase (delta-12 desaturase)
MIEFAELAEDSPIATLWHCFVHQAFGWPGYLLFNLTGQDNKGKAFPHISHFWYGSDSVFWKKEQVGQILLSDIGVAGMIGLLVVAGQIFGSWNVIVLWGVPWLWVNNWIVAITFLQHTDVSLPHYNNNTFTFPRGATATIDRDLGFIDTHLFHDIIGTHVCHHLVSTIPFYHAGEASVHIRKIMGVHYKADVKTPFWTAFWRNQRACKFVEESEGKEGSGVFMFRNLYKNAGETKARDLTGGIAAKKEEKVEKEEVKEAKLANRGESTKTSMATAMSSSRNLDAKRRFSQSAQQGLKSGLPLLAE